MENNKFTKRAVVISIIAVLMCCSLLIGGTFAWFTDTATTGINTIESGNLDIELYYVTQSDIIDGTVADSAWKPVSADESVFNPSALWEPGYTEVVYFKVVNKGNLALKYRMGVEIYNELPSINKYGAQFFLSDYIMAWRADGADFDSVYVDNRENAQKIWGMWDAGTALNVAVEGAFNGLEATEGSSLNASQWLEAGETFYTGLYLYMPETVGNEANYLTGENAPLIELGVYVTATQYTFEEDSFDDQYDKDAEYEDVKVPGFIYDEDDLIAAIAKGGSYKLGSDINLIGDSTVVTADTVLDLNGHNINAARGLISGTSTEYVSTLTVDGVNLTINGSGSVNNNAEEAVYALAVINNANVVVNGGTYKSYHDAVYVKTGTLTVNDGIFHATCDLSSEPETNGSHNPYPINCDNKPFLNGTAKVIMKGGALVNCDPSNMFEAKLYNVSFVAEGYHVEKDPQSDTYVLFNVVKD